MCKMLNTFAKIRIIFDIRMAEAEKYAKSCIAQTGIPLLTKRYACLIQEVYLFAQRGIGLEIIPYRGMLTPL